jgi:hypothetical protein
MSNADKKEKTVDQLVADMRKKAKAKRMFLAEYRKSPEFLSDLVAERTGKRIGQLIGNSAMVDTAARNFLAGSGFDASEPAKAPTTKGDGTNTNPEKDNATQQAAQA